MTYNEKLRYTEDHEWLDVDGDTATIGITDFAADQLGDIVYVEVPEAGTPAEAGSTIAEIESTKSVGEILAPVAGEIIEVNQTAADNPEIVNQDPFGAGWLLRIRMTGELPDGLLSAEENAQRVAEAGE